MARSTQWGHVESGQFTLLLGRTSPLSGLPVSNILLDK